MSLFKFLSKLLSISFFRNKMSSYNSKYINKNLENKIHHLYKSASYSFKSSVYLSENLFAGLGALPTRTKARNFRRSGTPARLIPTTASAFCSDKKTKPCQKEPRYPTTHNLSYFHDIPRYIYSIVPLAFPDILFLSARVRS